MTNRELLAAEFEQHRPRLQGVAYRMLSSVSEAEDAVQESWMRLDRAGGDDVEDLGAWLTVVVARVCLDMLRARRARREFDPGGVSLPEPIVTADPEDDPEEEAELADSIGLALLVVLDSLTPAERLAFVLHDMFAVSYEEIAGIVDRSPAAARQLASRARRRVQGEAPKPDADLRLQRKLVDAFLAAARAGDFEGLLAVLDPEVVFRADVGKLAPRFRTRLHGAEEVARELVERGAPFAPLAQPAIVNGAAGAVVRVAGRPFSVVAFTVSKGRIVEIDIVVDPEKLGTISVQE